MTDIVERTRKLLAEAEHRGAWYVEENDDFWELYAENKVPAPGENGLGIVDGFYVFHPFKLAKCAKRNQAFAEYWPEPGDAALIAAAPSILAELADEVERLRAELEEAKHTAWERSEHD